MGGVGELFLLIVTPFCFKAHFYPTFAFFIKMEQTNTNTRRVLFKTIHLSGLGFHRQSII